MASPPFHGTQSWEYHTRRIRRMQRLQVIALAVVCLGSILAAVVFGRALLSSTAEQRTAAGDVRELMDVRIAVLGLENSMLRHRADPSRRLATGRLVEVVDKFRADMQALIDRHAGGDGPAATAARGKAARELDRVVTALTPVLRMSADRGGAGADRVVDIFTDSRFRLVDALEEWIGAASIEYSGVVDRGERSASRLFVGTVALMLLLGIIAWGWWVLLERARTRMTDSVGDSERRFRSLVQNSSDAVLIVDGDGAIRYAAPPVEGMFGWPAPDLVDMPLMRLVAPEADGPMSRLRSLGVDALLVDETILWQGLHADGTIRHLETVATDMLDDPAIAGVVLNTRDVSDRREAEMELAYRANHDALTDLVNRSMFEQRLDRLIQGSAAGEVLPAVLILDLDDFKTINDSLGHVAGDELLIEVAQRLRRCLRAGDLAARFGGDEFAVLLEATRDRAEIEALAGRLVDTIARPMLVQGRELEMRASIGIALVDDASHSAATLIRDADVAMYVAKESGRAGYVVFDDSMSARASERLGLIADLRKAVDRGEITVNYQPIVALDTGRIAGLEALVRWDHPTRGWVSPTRFVELAEETGQIQVLGAWVLDRALAELGALAVIPGTESLHVAVNVSMRQLEQETFAASVARALERSGVRAERLTIEITETALMRDPETMARQLRLLKRLGVSIAVDDFGTGYSSLSYLAHLPIDIVKIDRSFVKGIGHRAGDSRIATMIMRIGESLSLRTVAEGVETPRQADALRRIGCPFAQGFLFGRPMPMARIRARLETSGLTIPPDRRELVAR